MLDSVRRGSLALADSRVWRPVIVFAVTLVAGCASASGGGERGLRPLRDALTLMPPRGQVERDGRMLWLVDGEVGARIVGFDPAAGHCGVPDDEPAMWRLYEGTPGGAALSFKSSAVTVWWHDDKQDCVMSSEVLQSPVPKDFETLRAAETWRYDKADEGLPDTDADAGADTDADPEADAEDVEPEGEKDDLGAPIETLVVSAEGRPSIKARISANLFEVIGPTGEVLYEDMGSRDSSECTAQSDALLGRATRADGTLLLTYKRSGKSTAAPQYSDAEEPCTADTYTVESELDVWVAIDPSGAKADVIYNASSSEGGEYSQSSSATSFTLRLPVGELSFGYSLQNEGYESRNGGSTEEWSWKYEPPKGKAVTLAESPSAY